MVEISTSLFTITENDLIEALRLASNSDYFHIDVTDGIHVKDKHGGASLFFDDSYLRIITANTSIPLDVHLMIAEPERHIERYAQHRPEYISFHLEATDNPRRVIEEIHKYQIDPAIALNPHTPLSEVVDLLPDLKMVLLMSVIPGLGGQQYHPHVTGKIAELKQIIENEESDVKIEVDGGIKVANAYHPIDAGADILVSGTGVYNHGTFSPNMAIQIMKELSR